MIQNLLSLLLSSLILLSITWPAVAGEKLTAEKIIQRYQKVVGAEAARKLQSTQFIGQATVTTAQGEITTGRFNYLFTNALQARLDIETTQQPLRETYNGNLGWREDPAAGLRALSGNELNTLRLRTIFCSTRLRGLANYRIFPKNARLETIEGQDWQVVDYLFIYGNTTASLYFDPRNGLLMKEIFRTPEYALEISYRDYQVVDGIMEPFTIIRQEAGVKYELSAQRITHNQFIDHTFFRYPKANTDAPLPDLTSLIQQITANQATLEQRREEYSFRKTVREQELDKNGKEEKTTIKVYDVLPIGRHFVSRLLSVDGQNLSPDKQQKEAKRVTQEIEKIRREQAKALKAKEAKQSNNAKQDDEDAISLLKFLQIIRVTDAYRDRFRGQAVIVIEFEPNKEFKPRNRTESLISKLAGSIFVDEQERQVVRLESRFVEGFKLLGGLASVSPASAFVFEQQKVNNDLWLPAYAEIAIGARVLFSKRNLNNSERYSDYRRYQTDVELKFESE